MNKSPFLLALCGMQILFVTPSEAAQAQVDPPAQGQVRMLATGALSAVDGQLQPLYREQLGLAVIASFGSSLRSAPTSVPRRLEAGEQADVVLTSRQALDDLAAKGLVVPGSQTDIMQSALGIVVRGGSPVPDIATQAQTAALLLQAKSIAYSASLSGTYYETEMLKNLGIQEQVLPKSRKISGEKVAAVVARGEADVGLQQVSELLAVPGVTFAGKLPQSIQRYTVFSAGISTNASNPEGARALIRFLVQSPDVRQVLSRNGLEPM